MSVALGWQQRRGARSVFGSLARRGWCRAALYSGIPTALAQEVSSGYMEELPKSVHVPLSLWFSEPCWTMILLQHNTVYELGHFPT